MAGTLEKLRKEHSEWLLFRKPLDKGPAGEREKESLEVVRDIECDGRCESLLAHHYHVPQLWFLHVEDGAMFGCGWNMTGRTPLRAVGDENAAEQLRYLALSDDDKSTPAATLYSRQFGDLVLLAALHEAEDGSMDCVIQVVTKAGEPAGKEEEVRLARECCGGCASGGTASCSCHAAHTDAPDADGVRVRVTAAPQGDSWTLFAGDVSAAIRSRHITEAAMVDSCVEFVEKCLESSATNTEDNDPSMVEPGSQKNLKVCSICGSGFLKSYHLRRHYESVHYGLKRHECKYCHRTFSQTGHLNEHIRVFHLMTSSSKCDRCGKCFGARSKLARHIMAVHENRRSYQCEVCGKAFKERSHVNKHYLSHQTKPTEGGRPLAPAR